MARSEENMTQSAQGSRRQVLSEVTWESVNDPGAYVERGSGDLFRFPKESADPWRLSVHRERVSRRFGITEA